MSADPNNAPSSHYNTPSSNTPSSNTPSSNTPSSPLNPMNETKVRGEGGEEEDEDEGRLVDEGKACCFIL